MEVGAFYLPSVGRKEDILQGMAGKRTDLYKEMLQEVGEQICYMDEHGYYGAGFTEHHFHIEGEEVSTNPVLLDLYFGMQTKKMKFGQHVGLDDPPSGQEYEDLKRELFEEHYDIIMKAWTQDTFSHQGKHWTIPTKDIIWAAAEVSRKYGQGVDENDRVVEIGIAPPVHDKKVPDLFMPFATSERSIKWGLERNIVPVTILTHLEITHSQFLAGQEAAAAAGRDLKFGEGMAMSREVVVADTDEEAEALAREAGSFIWNNFFVPFGFNAAVAKPGEGPFDMPATFETISERGLVIHGSPDTVNRKLEKLLTDFPVDYFWMFIYNHMPHDKCMKSLDLLTNKVWPNFTDKIGPHLAAAKSA